MVEATLSGTSTSLRPGGAVRPASGRVPLPVAIFLFGIVVPLFFPLGPIAMNIFRLVLLVMFIPLFIQVFTGKAGRVLISDVLLFAHSLWMLLTIWIHHGGAVVQFGGSNVLELLGSYLLARVYIRDMATFIATMKWICISVCLSAPFAVYEALTGVPILLKYINALPYFYGLPDLRPETRMGLERVQFTFSTSIHYGIYSAMVLSFALMIWGQENKPRLGPQVMGGGLVGFATFLSLSSAPILSMAMQIGFVGWDRVLGMYKARWKIFLGLCASAYVFVALASSRPVINVFMTYMTFNAGNAWWRLNAFEYGMKTVWAYPIFGIGLREDWERPEWMYNPSVDNHWLGVAMRHGLVGFLFLAIAIGLLIYAVARARLGEDVLLNRMRRCWLFALWAQIFALATVYMWGSSNAMIFFFLGAGAWLIFAEPSETAPQAETNAPAQAGRTSQRRETAPGPVRSTQAFSRGEQTSARTMDSVQGARETLPYSRSTSPGRYTRRTADPPTPRRGPGRTP